MDDDQAGHGALDELRRLTPIRRVDVPVGKDVNDFYLAEGAEKVREWVLEVVNG
jgi:DNA primase